MQIHTFIFFQFKKQLQIPVVRYIISLIIPFRITISDFHTHHAFSVFI